MEFAFPKKIKTVRLNSRVIYVNPKNPEMYLKFGTVRFYGFAKNSKDKLAGIEFDKNIKSREDTKTYFKARIGWGAFVEVKDLRRVTDENFNIEEYKEYLESGKEDEEENAHIKEENEGLVLKQKKEMIFEDAEEQEEDAETESQLVQSEVQLKQSKSKSNIIEPEKKIDVEIESKKDKEEAPDSAKLTPINKKVDNFANKNISENTQPVPKPIEKPVASNNKETNNQNSKPNNEQIKKLEEENHKYYIQVQQLEIQLTKLKVENNNLNENLYDLQKDYSSLKENYENVKNNTEHTQEEHIQLLEELTSIKTEKTKLEDKLDEVTSSLEKFSDYDDFKKKFEYMSVNYESLKIENEESRKKLAENEKTIKELREEIEIMELEADITARDENIPTNPDELKKNYGLIQRAFQKLDLDIQIQKEEYETKIQELNDEITSIKNNYRNILSSEEVTSIIDKKDSEIKSLKEVIDQYSHANKLVEQLSEKTQKREEQIEKLKKELEKALDSIDNYKEENTLLEEITKEYEVTVEFNEKKMMEMQENINKLEEEIATYDEKILKYKSKLEQVSQEREQLELQSSNLETESQKYSTLYQEYNKVLQEKQSKIREKMNFLIHGKECYWESLKWKLYFDCIPSDINKNLHFEYFDKYKQMCNINDRIDIIIENLLLHYLFNESLKLDNLNLYNICKDMVIYLLKYQNYLNLLKIKYLQCTSHEEIKTLSATVLYAEVQRNFQNVIDIYDLLKDNELSTQISFSEFIESYYRLKEDVQEEEFSLTPNLKFKHLLCEVIEKMVLSYVDDSAPLKTKEAIENVMSKIVYVNDMVFEINLDEKTTEKLETAITQLPDNIIDFKAWFESFYKTIDELYLEQDEVLDYLKTGIWNETIVSTRKDLDNFENVKNELELVKSNLSDLENQLKEKTKEIVLLNKLKVNQDSKILKLQGIANNKVTLELEVSELKKNEKQLKDELEELRHQKKELESQARTEPIPEQLGRNSVRLHQVVKNKIMKGNTMPSLFNKNNSMKAVEYNPVSKFEINSLNAIINNLINELAFYKGKFSLEKLKKFEEKTPTFHRILNEKQKEKYELSNIKDAISNLESSKKLIKHEITKLDLIDITDKSKTLTQAKNFYASKTKIDHYFWNTINHMEKAVESDDKMLEIGYDINFEKELLKPDNKQQVIYGKLNILDNFEKVKEAGGAKAVPLNIALI